MVIICVVWQVVGPSTILPYSTLGEVRERIRNIAPHMLKINTVETPLWLNEQHLKACAKPSVKDTAPLSTPISNFFMTDAISRTSRTMAKCMIAKKEMRY